MSTTFGYVFSKPKELIQDLWTTLKPQQEPRSAGLLSALRQSRAFQAIIVIFTGRNTWASFQWIRCRTSTAYDVIFYRILIWQKSGSFLCQHLSLVKLAQWLSLIMARSEEYVQKLEQVGFAIPRVYVYNNTFLAFCQTQITIHPSSHFKPFHTFTLYKKNLDFSRFFSEKWQVSDLPLAISLYEGHNVGRCLTPIAMSGWRPGPLRHSGCPSAGPSWEGYEVELSCPVVPNLKKRVLGFPCFNIFCDIGNYVILWYGLGSQSHFFRAFWGWMYWVQRGMASAAISLCSFCRNKFTQQGSDVQGDDDDEGWSNFPASHQSLFHHPGSWRGSVVNDRRCGSFSGCYTRYQQLHRPWTQLGGLGPRCRLLGDLLQVDAGDVKVTHLKSLISPWKMMGYHYQYT